MSGSAGGPVHGPVEDSTSPGRASAGVPGHGTAAVLFEQATRAARAGAWEAAEGPVRQLLRDLPESGAALALGAQVLLARDRYREAHALALRLANIASVEPAFLMDAVRLLRRFEESERLAKLAAQIPDSKLQHPGALAELALHLSAIGEYDAAHARVDRMLALVPRSPDAHYLRGLLEMFAGRKESSLTALRKALALEPRMANAHWLVAMQEGAENAAAHVDAMVRVLPAIRPGTEAQAYLLYAMHHRLHALGRHRDAWMALDRGMQVLRGLTPYSREESRALFDALKRLELPSTRQVTSDSTATASPTGLIFIVGMFRSGTTLVETLLGRHPDVTDGGETYQFSAAMREAADHGGDGVLDREIVARASSVDFSLVRQRMLAFAAWRGQGRKWLTEKLPSNFLNVGFILQALPDARIVHLRRDAADTCFSNLRTIFRGAAPYACDPGDVADYFLGYEDLMAHWHHVGPGRILDLRYDELVRNPEEETRRLLAFCGLEPVGDLLEARAGSGHVATASAAHARQGILKGRERAWQPYEAELLPMLRMLGKAR